MAFHLLVPNIPMDVFMAYDYGYGKVISMEPGEIPGTHDYVVDYGDDEYRCRYQDGRFASGLYFSAVIEV